jgi:mono/diheme cytochrome c family protein
MTTRWSLIGLVFAALTTAAAQGPDGKTLYEANCKMCHGAEGIPSAVIHKAMPAIPTFDRAFLTSHSEDSVVKVLQRGGKTMKSFKDKLSHEQMSAVAKYVRQLASKGR